ncbi:MAG: hypothetical protein AAF799_15735 [Myxococcota bacterium]
MHDPHPAPPAAPRRERRLIRAQAISGLVFATFLFLHLLNLMVSAFGPGLYDAFQIRVRPLYQFPLFEIGGLLTALLIHIAAGVARIRQRPRTRNWSRLPLRTRLHRMSAYFLLLVIFGHMAATRAPSLLDDVHLGFIGVSFALVYLPGFFVPYYILLGLTGLYHGTYGVIMSLKALGVRVPSVSRLGNRFWVPLGAAALLVVLGVLSFGGVLYAIDDPFQSDFARYAAERFGVEP